MERLKNLLNITLRTMIGFAKYRKFILFSILIFSGQSIFSQSKDLISVKALPNGNFAIPAANNYFLAQFKDCFYKIRPNGLVTKYYSNSSDSVNFNLELERYFSIEYAEISQFENLLIISYTETDAETGSSCIAVFDLNSSQKKWTYSKLAPNLSKVIIHNSFIYLTSFSVIVKLDLFTGKEVFRLDNLYDRGKYSFNSFDDIQFKGDTAIYLSQNWYSKRLDKILVNDRTNKLIQIIK